MNFPPCIGCGHCCFQARCGPSRRLRPDDKEECPFLYWHLKKERYWCAIAGLFEEELSIDQGCPSSLNSWRKDVRERRDEL